MSARIALVFVLAGLLVGGVAGLLMAEDPDPRFGFCTAEGLLVEPPDGWEFIRDWANDCKWTLFDENGRRAPAELYEGLPIDPPYPLLVNRIQMASVLAILVSLVGLSLIWVGSRQRRVAETID